jgi:quinoprotein glucose dehydrogenase
MSFDPTTRYLFINTSNIGQTAQMVAAAPGAAMPYVNRGAYGRFLDPQGHPCNQPPWGELIAIDLNGGDIAWRIPLGIAEDLEAEGVKNTGAVNLGGSIATASGLLFIAATNDSRLRAFDSKSGKVLWETVLEGSGNNNPITYRGRDGKQYVAVVAGGSGRAARTIGVPAGARVPQERPADVVAAYALP